MTEQIENYSYDDLIKYVKSDGLNLKNIPDVKRTTNICIAAIMQNTDALSLLNDSPLLTEKIQMIAINRNGLAIKHIDPAKITEKMVFAALKQNHKSVQHIGLPWIKRDDIICPIINNDPSVLQFIKPEYLSNSMIKKVIDRNVASLAFIVDQTSDICKYALDITYEALQHINKSAARTNEVLLYGVTKNGFGLRFIDKISEQTEELCMAAINNNGLAIQYVADNFLTEELCIAAIRKNPNTYKHNDKHLITKTKELLHIAKTRTDYDLLKMIDINNFSHDERLEFVKINGRIIEHIDNNNLTDEIIFEAIKQTGSGLRFIPIKRLTYDLCFMGVQSCGYAITNVPTKYIDHDIRMAAINNYPRSIVYIPHGTPRYSDLVLYAVQKDGLVLEYISIQYRTAEICYEAIKSVPYSVKFVPDEIVHNNSLNIDFHIMAVTMKGQTLEYIKRHNHTKKLCMAAIENDPDVFNYVYDDKCTGKYSSDRISDKDIEEICLFAIKMKPALIYKIGGSNWTEDIIDEILKIDKTLIANNMYYLPRIITNKDKLNCILTSVMQNNIYLFDLITDPNMKRDLWQYDVNYLLNIKSQSHDDSLNDFNKKHNDQIIFRKYSDIHNDVVCHVCSLVCDTNTDTTFIHFNCKCNASICVLCFNDWYHTMKHSLCCMFCDQIIDMKKASINI